MGLHRLRYLSRQAISRRYKVGSYRVRPPRVTRTPTPCNQEALLSRLLTESESRCFTTGVAAILTSTHRVAASEPESPIGRKY